MHPFELDLETVRFLLLVVRDVEVTDRSVYRGGLRVRRPLQREQCSREKTNDRGVRLLLHELVPSPGAHEKTRRCVAAAGQRTSRTGVEATAVPRHLGEIMPAEKRRGSNRC